MSTISSIPHRRRSQVRSAFVPIFSYLLRRHCRSVRTLWHPSWIVFIRSCFAGDKGCAKIVSSTSLSTAWKDKTSSDMFRKLSGASLQDLYTFHASWPRATKSPTLNPKLMLRPSFKTTEVLLTMIIHWDKMEQIWKPSVTLTRQPPATVIAQPHEYGPSTINQPGVTILRVAFWHHQQIRQKQPYGLNTLSTNTYQAQPIVPELFVTVLNSIGT